MRAELLKVLDRAYLTDRFTTSAHSGEPVTPSQCISILVRSLEERAVISKMPIELEKKEFDELTRLIELGEVIKDERTSANIEEVVDIYQQSRFAIAYTTGWREELCTLKEVIVWHYLSHCKVWPTICKQLNKSRDKEYKLRCLIEWYFEFAKRVGITDMFEQDALSKKDQRTVIKKKLISSSNSAMIEAVMAKDYGKVQALLQSGIDIESIEPPNERFQGVTKLRASHIACDNADIQMCRLLDNYKANWEAEDSELMTPIFYAIRAGSLLVLRFLVEEKGVNMERLEIQKRTPFYWACTQGEMEIIKYLRDKGADINRASQIGRTALSKACFLGRRDIVEYLINCKQINLNCKDKKGRTPLHNAVFGPKGGRQAHKFGTCESDSPECAVLLLEKGVDANQTDNDLNTGLHIALSSEALGSISVLVAYGCDLTRRNKFQETAIMVGCKFGHLEAVKILIEVHNDSVITKDFVGCNCLVLVAKNLSDGKKVHPLFEYLLPIYMKQILAHQNALQDIEDTFNRVISHKANQQILACQRYLRENGIKVHPKLDVLKKSLEELDDNVTLELLCNSPLSNHELESLVGCIVSLRKLTLMESITARLDKQLSMLEFPLYSLDKWKHVNDKMLTAAITLLNVDILTGRFEGGHNILHFLTENKKIGSLTQILKLFVGIYGGGVRNHFLLKYNHEELKKMLKELLVECDNASGMTCGELALVRKYMDVYKILQTYIHNYSDYSQQDPSQHFRIEEYVAMKETDESELERFKGHEQAELLNSLIDKCTVMPDEELLQRFNTLSKPEEQLRHSFTHINDTSIEALYKELKANRKIYFCQTLQELQQNLECFHGSTVVAIDLEYFVEKITNQNVICTLQLSCAAKDVVVDCLRIDFQLIRKEIQSLFHNPSVVKVLHGCEQDLIILKTNFNLSLVNCMDTARIEMSLIDKIEMPGLKVLASKYLHGLEMDKQYQTSEWRLRPLPKAMLEYARCDSLVLLLIYLNILRAIPVSKIKDIILSNLKTSFKNSKQQAQLIKGVCPNKGPSDN